MTSPNPTVIVYARRTPIGKFSGGLANVPAPKLAATLVKDCLQVTGVAGQDVQEIIMGRVLTAGVGQAPARQAAIYGGLPTSVCATTVGRVCGSGLKAVMLADQAIRLGDADIILAGGQENMSLAPHLLMSSRQGYRFGPFEAKDSMQWDGLWDPYSNVAMGNCGEMCAKEYNFTREAQDQFALESYRRARKASESGWFRNEIVPVHIEHPKKPVTIDTDEEPFSVELEELTTLRPAFDKAGTITAGNASSINDGAGLVLAMNLKTAEKRGLKPLAKIVAQASFAQDPNWFTTAPIGCIRKVLEKSSLETSDIDLFEINEAFSCVAMAAMKDLKIPHEKLNIHGGAVAIGHPIGASGARILTTLIHALTRTGGRRGVACLCIGGGEASAVVVERV